MGRCLYCNKVFKSEAYLERHIEHRHPATIQVLFPLTLFPPPSSSVRAAPSLSRVQPMCVCVCVCARARMMAGGRGLSGGLLRCARM